MRLPVYDPAEPQGEDLSTPSTSSLIETITQRIVPDLSWTLTRRLLVSSMSSRSYVKQQLLKSDRINNAGDLPIGERRAIVSSLLDGMAADVQIPQLRVLGYVLRKAWRRMYDAIYLHKEGLERVRKAQLTGPVVLLPTHRSHIDYVIMTYLLVAYGLQAPFVVAGDNLNIPLVGNILHK